MKGFAITINDIRNWVTFKEYNNKVVVCHLKDDLGNVFIGKALCNTEAGDVFKRETGELLSLERAIKLRYNRDMGFINRLYKESVRQINAEKKGLLEKWHTKNIKLKTKEEERNFA